MVGEKEFFRQGVPHGNSLWLTLYFDTSDGNLSVRTYRSSKRGSETEIEQEPLAVYLANGKSTKAKRALHRYLDRLARTVSTL